MLPPFRMLWRELAQTIEGKHRLMQRVFGPKGTVLIKCGDAILWLNITSAVSVGRILNEPEDGLFGQGVVAPNWSSTVGAA